MLLIVEGMDRCGKTTLIGSLRRNFFTSPKTLVAHSSAPPKIENPGEWEASHYAYLLRESFKLIDEQNFDIIFDRFHLGAIVYGAKFRKSDPAPIYGVDRTWLHGRKDAALLLLTDYYEEIIRRDDGESLEKTAYDFDETRNAFIYAFDGSECPNKLHINITDNGGFTKTYPKVEAWLQSLR